MKLPQCYVFFIDRHLSIAKYFSETNLVEVILYEDKSYVCRGAFRQNERLYVVWAQTRYEQKKQHLIRFLLFAIIFYEL